MAKKKDPTSEHNLYWEAFINQYNLIGLGAFVAMSAILGSPLPFLLALGLELLYVAFIPETEFFKQSVLNKYNELDDQEQALKMQQRLDRLHPVQRRRYEEIAALVDSTKANLDENESMSYEVVHKLETLRTRYLGLMELLNAYESYLSSIQPGRIDDNIRDVEREIKKTESERVKATLEERRAVLTKRKSRLERVHENNTIVRTQVMTIEDMLRLIHESSMTIQNPADIGRQIDDLLIDVEATEEAVSDLDSIGSVSGADDLAAFDRELEQAIELHEMETHVKA